MLCVEDRDLYDLRWNPHDNDESHNNHEYEHERYEHQIVDFVDNQQYKDYD